MLLKFKNKHLMALDKIIREAEGIGGLIESVILEPKEGYGLILEIINLGAKYTADICILNVDGEDMTRAELIWGGRGVDRHEHIKSLIGRWYKIQCTVTYKDIPLCIVKPKLNIPKEEQAAGWTEEPKKEEKTEVVVEKEKPQKIPEVDDIIKSWKLYDEPTEDVGRVKPWACAKCGSPLKTKWFGLKKAGGCMRPSCANYWENDK